MKASIIYRTNDYLPITGDQSLIKVCSCFVHKNKNETDKIAFREGFYFDKFHQKNSKSTTLLSHNDFRGTLLAPANYSNSKSFDGCCVFGQINLQVFLSF